MGERRPAREPVPGAVDMARVGARTYPPDAPWIERDGRIHLLGGHCTKCGSRAFPRRDICSGCGSAGQVVAELAATGILYTYTKVHSPPAGFPAAYIAGFVDLDDGVRVFGQVEGPIEDLRLDARVSVRIGVIRTDPDGVQVESYRFGRVG